uniref:Helicase ATP-binding domain-containing protein n=2 Tax=Strongyloides stercoralis TaxID=6248 RepID=A0A0K0ERW9_STRER
MPIFDVEDISVSFPYTPYPCQNAFIESVITALKNKQNAALESPTGTGKTLSLLCSTLAWLQAEKVKLAPEIVRQAAISTNKNNPNDNIINFPKIIYASRTHSQLTQVISELNKTSYKHTNTVLLASRDQLCINEHVQKIKNSHSKGMMCRSLVTARKCNYFTTLETEEDMLPMLYENDGDILDLDNLVKKAKKLKHCPFFKSKKDFSKADLILLPYNYILDPKLRAAQKIDLSGNVIIFDEAHNLESICEESSSINFTSTDISLCLKECKGVMELYLCIEETVRDEMDNTELGFGEVNLEKKFPFEKNDCAQLLLLLQNFEEVINKIDYSTATAIKDLNGYLFDGKFMIDLLQKGGIEKGGATSIPLLIDKMGQFVVKNQMMAKEFGLTSTEKLLEFANLISTVYADSYEMNETSTTGHAMRYLQSRGVHSIIVASGTLSPIHQYINSIGIDFPVTLENEHAADCSQIFSGAIKHSNNGEAILGTFKNRNNINYMHELGTIIYESSKIIPQGILVFFPSYTQMYSLIQSWKERKLKNGRSVWVELEKYKDLYVEPKDKSDVPLILGRFGHSIDEGKGAILFAVCRGKMSEGIDFKDSQSRGVIIIGIPFPPLKEPKIVLKKIYLGDNLKNNPLIIPPDEWYKLEGIRAVNQAIGRVIRHKDDFGAVLLLDQRFATMDKCHYPSWMRGSIKSYDNSKVFLEKCFQFFSNKGISIKQPIVEEPICKTFSKPKLCCNLDDSHNEYIKVKKMRMDDSQNSDKNLGNFVNSLYENENKCTPEVRRRKITIKKKNDNVVKVEEKFQNKNKVTYCGANNLLETIPSVNKFKEALNNIDSSKRKTILEFLKEYKTSVSQSYLDLLNKVTSITLPNDSLIVIGMALYIKEEDKMNFLKECVKIGIIKNGTS